MSTTTHHRRFLCASPDPFRPLEPECRVVQFDQPLTPADLKKAGSLMRDRPEVELYVYRRAAMNLDFLQYFPGLRRLHLALYGIEDIAGFASLNGSLETLTFGKTKKKFSLRFVESLPRLNNLFLVGHKKELSSIQAAPLTKLGLSGITLPDLSVLLPLKNLSDLSILLGGTTNLDLLPELGQLERIFLMRITKLSDLAVLKEVSTLKTMRLDWLRNVTSLPSLAGLRHLEEVTLDTMKGLTDLSPIALAPVLRSLKIGAMPQLKAENFRCFLGHPSLKRLGVWTGRTKVNDAVRRMFPGIADPS